LSRTPRGVLRENFLIFGEKLIIHSYNTPKQIISALISKGPPTQQVQLQSVSALLSTPRTGCAWRTTPMWREQAEIRWARRGIFIIAWCHSVKLCAYCDVASQCGWIYWSLIHRDVVYEPLQTLRDLKTLHLFPASRAEPWK